MRSKLTRSKQALEPVLNSFAFNKLLPGVLIGLFAYNATTSDGGDGATFVTCMVVFWAAIGLGHALAQLATQATTTED